MNENTTAFDSNALGRAIAMQIFRDLPPAAIEKLQRRIQSRRNSALGKPSEGAKS